MAVVDSDGVDDSVYRTTFDPATEPPVVAVVEAIEAAAGSTSSEWLLADSIDPDTLQRLYRDDSADSWMLTFDVDGFEITLWDSGRIHVDTTAATLQADSERQSSGEPTQPAGVAGPPTGPTL